MKKSLEHLPKEKKKGLDRVVSVIRKMCDDIEIIILFGSHARGDYKDDDDLLPGRKSGAASDYDIMVICRHKATVDNTLLWSNISKCCNGHYTSSFRIIVHDIKYIKKRLKEIHYFFSDIVKEACLLYTSGKYELNIGKKLTPEQRIKIAREHFKHWFESAKEFRLDFENAFNREGYNNAAFHLHQSAESAYKALLLVYTNYAPYSHFLVFANQQTREILPGMEEIFPCRTEADKKLFKLFDYAYIGARYDPEFEISKKDLDYFSGRVKLLLELTEKLCNEKIENFRKSCM